MTRPEDAAPLVAGCKGWPFAKTLIWFGFGSTRGRADGAERLRQMNRKKKSPIVIKTPPEIEATLKYIFSAPPPPYIPPKEYIYLTKSDFGYKIGKTTRPDKRPLSVAGNMPIKLSVIAIIEVPNSKEAERRLHSLFDDKRLRGEWFALTDEDVEFVKQYPASWENIKIDPDDVPY